MKNQSSEEFEKNDDSLISIKGIFGILAIALVIIAVYISAYFLIENRADWGQYGDFIGGTLNPTLTFLTFCVVILTLRLQKIELIESRKEMKRSADALEKQILELSAQKFEASFFQMLMLLNGIINAMDIRVSGRRTTKGDRIEGYEIKGRDCFKTYANSLRDHYKIIREAPESINLTDANVIRLAYAEFWKTYQQDLGHYFRLIYNIIRMLSEREEQNKKNGNEDQSNMYFRLLRAQLSNYELVLILYNCQTELGSKLEFYVDKHKILDNLPEDILFHESHHSMFVR